MTSKFFVLLLSLLLISKAIAGPASDAFHNRVRDYYVGSGYPEEFLRDRFWEDPDLSPYPESLAPACRRQYIKKAGATRRKQRLATWTGTGAMGAGVTTIVATGAFATAAAGPVALVAGPIIALGALVLGISLAPNKYERVVRLHNYKFWNKPYMAAFRRRARRIHPELGIFHILERIDEHIDDGTFCQGGKPWGPNRIRRYILNEFRNNTDVILSRETDVRDDPRHHSPTAPNQPPNIPASATNRE